MKPSQITVIAFFILLPHFFTWNLDGAHDIWWHLKSAELLLENVSFPTPDTYSFTAAVL